jgi:hypothetical protein
VTFGTTPATNVVVGSGTQITATAPAGSAGPVTVTVTVGGLSGSLTSAFTYVAGPTVSSVSPNIGSTAGATPVTITGTNFVAGTTVTFGPAAATSVVVVNGTTITAATPAGSAGAVTVTATVSGQSGSLVSGFTYVTPSPVTAPGNFAGALIGTSVPTYVAGQEFYNASAGSTFTTSPFNSTGADLLVMLLGSHNQAAFTVTDSYNNTWLPLAGPAYKVGSAYYPMESELFYVPNAHTGANHTITVDLSQAEPLVVSVVAISGDNIYSPIDAYSSITGDNGTISEYIASSPLKTSQPNDLLLGMIKGFGNNTYAAGTGYTNLPASTGLNFSAETGTASSAGNYASTFTASVGDFWQTVTAAIAPKPNETALSWTASSSSFPIANYYIERCSGLNCSSSFLQIGSVSGSTLTYTDTTVSAGTAYTYRVRSEDSNGNYGPYSSTLAVTPITPQVVSSFAATPTRALSWNASTETGGSISQYAIERCTGLGCTNFSQIAATANTSYTDASAAAGTTYNYRVRAQDANNIYGPYSVVATASIPAYFDNAADGGNNGANTSSLTYSYTVGANSNRLLLVSLISTVDDISSVTYATASMTLVNKVVGPDGALHYLYYLLSPTSGTNIVSITANSAHYLISEASSWYNVAQSGQPLASTSNTAPEGVVSLTTSLPASSNNAIVVESMWAYTGIISGQGSTSLVVDSAFQGLGMFSSVPSPVTQAFPVSMTNTWNGLGAASSLMASFALASNGTPGITFDNSVDGGNNGGSTTSLTYPFTVGSGSNRLLVVNLIGDVTDNISSVTYGTSPLTLLGKIQAPPSAAGANNWQYLYYLLNPPSGPNNIVITAGSAQYLNSQAASWYNVKQSAQPDALTTNTVGAGSTSITTSLTTMASGSLVVQGIWSQRHLEAGAGATPIVIDAAFDAAGLFVSTGSPVSPAGNVSMTTLWDGSASSGVIMVSFAPAQ